MTKIEELENALLSQIGMLNDNSVMSTEKEAKELIQRSKAISDLSSAYIDVQKIKLESQRIKIESIKVMHETAVGIGKADDGVKKYLGIEGF